MKLAHGRGGVEHWNNTNR